jgi:hypothetical protein
MSTEQTKNEVEKAVKNLANNIHGVFASAYAINETVNHAWLYNTILNAFTPLIEDRDAKAREVVEGILEEETTYDNYNNTQCYQAVSVKDIKAIALSHNIDLSTKK